MYRLGFVMGAIVALAMFASAASVAADWSWGGGGGWESDNWTPCYYGHC